jgi:GNAT superfamily N-acetyltransferase
MSALEIVPVDDSDDGLFRAWHETYDAASRAGREDVASPWALEEVRAQLADAGPRVRVGLWAGCVGGRVVVAGDSRLPQLDNLDHAVVSVHTHPDGRRRGHGSAMLAHLEDRVRAAGRNVLIAETTWAWDVAADGAGAAGPEFLRRHGFSLALTDVQRDLALPVTESRLDELAAAAAPHHAAYSLRSWAGPVPDDLVEGWAALAATLMTEAPVGELTVEAESPDVDALRADEDLIRRQGRTKYNTAAVDATGTVVAYTDIACSSHDSGRAYQWGTLVHRDHRGHRLGVAVKVANLRLLQDERADITRLTTYNAEINDHMVGINEQLGFVPVERFGEFQTRLQT